MAAAIRIIAFGVIAGASALSLIPLEFNFGSVLAGESLHDIIRPFIDRGIAQPVDESIKRFLRYGAMPARLIVTALETGVIPETDLIETGIRADLHNDEIAKLVALGRYKAYQEAVKEDLSLVREYKRVLVNEEIASQKDVIKLKIADRQQRIRDLESLIREERNTIKTELGKNTVSSLEAGSRLADLGLPKLVIEADIRAGLARRPKKAAA